MLVLRFEFYMAKVLSYIVTKKKGDAEHTKKVTMPGIIINKAEYEMEPQKREQTNIGINIQWTSCGAVTKLEDLVETLVPGVTKEQYLGMLDFIAKIESKDNNFFKEKVGMELKKKKPPMFGTNYKVVKMLKIVKIVTEEEHIEEGRHD